MSFSPMRLLHTLFIAMLATTNGSLDASAGPRHHQPAVSLGRGRPLTVTARQGIYRRGDDIIAPGGFMAHGYGYPAATPDERREVLNARIRASATGLYGAGVEGLGSWGYGDHNESGYDNPYYGNAFNRYVGFNGVPTRLAFGPGFANRRLADHETEESDEPAPSPRDLGFTTER